MLDARHDITKAIRLLGWEPQICLEQALQLSLEYFRTAVEAKRLILTRFTGR